MEVTDDSSTRVSVGSRRGNCSLACNRKLIPRLIAQIEEEISRARDTTRLPWRTNEPMVPRPPSLEFSSKQQVVVNAITCWLVNNEKQLQRLSLSLSALAASRFYINLNDGSVLQDSAGLCMRADFRETTVLFYQRIKRKILAQFWHHSVGHKTIETTCIRTLFGTRYFSLAASLCIVSADLCDLFKKRDSKSEIVNRYIRDIVEKETSGFHNWTAHLLVKLQIRYKRFF